MSQKQKFIDNLQAQTKHASQQLGIGVMALAAVIGMVELPDHDRTKIVLPNQPVFSFATENDSELNNPLRREREEEAGPHYISYSVAQRTPSRTGKR